MNKIFKRLATATVISMAICIPSYAARYKEVNVFDGGTISGSVKFTGKDVPPIEATVTQKSCTFEPFIQVMTNNSDFVAKNSDPILHNIHTYEMMGRARKTITNFSQPKQDSVIKKKVTLKRGSALKLECDAHFFMHGFIFVAKNPYYSIVDSNGKFSITDIPAGKYKIKAWHGTLGEKKANVEVMAGGSHKVDFTFNSK